jgi:hypothetical protein
MDVGYSWPMDDAGLREVFRGDLSSVEMAGAVLEGLGIATHRRFEFAGGLQLSANETSLVPGQTAVLFVPSIAYEEAKEALVAFEHPEGQYITELTGEIQGNQRKRRGVAVLILFVIFAPLGIALIMMAVVVVGSFFR